MMFAPLEGFRHVKVTDRHTALDYAQVLKELSDTHLYGDFSVKRKTIYAAPFLILSVLAACG
jgi:hypothetical protein